MVSDSGDFPPGPGEEADRQAYLATLPPPEHPGPGSVSALLAGLAAPGPGLAQAGDAAAPDPVAEWLALLVDRPVDEYTRLAVATIEPSSLSGTAVRDYLVLTDKVLATDTAVHHAAVLAVADTARTEVDATLAAHAAAARGTRWAEPDTERIVREDLERTLGCTRNDAEFRLDLAEALRDRVPATGRLLGSGMVSARKASQLVRLLSTTTSEIAAHIDHEVAEHLQETRPASLRRRIARRLLVLDSKHAARQDRAVVRDRAVRTWSNPDGSATLALTGPPEAIQHAWYATTGVALAQLRDCEHGCSPTCPHPTLAAADRSEVRLAPSVRPDADMDVVGLRPADRDGAVRPDADIPPSRPGAGRTAATGVRLVADTGAGSAEGQDGVRPGADIPLVERDGSARMDRARFDAAVDLLCSGYDAPWFPTNQGKRRTLVQLVTTVATLTGQDDNLAELVGHGPVTAETARRIAADAGMFQGLQVHPEMGFLMDAGKLCHDPPPELREFLLARRPVCAMPGCTRSVMQAADLDHTLEHRADGSGGPTAAWAIHGLCRFHHRCRTVGIWRLVEQRIDGSMVWIDPAGRRYVEPPHDLRPDVAA